MKLEVHGKFLRVSLFGTGLIFLCFTASSILEQCHTSEMKPCFLCHASTSSRWLKGALEIGGGGATLYLCSTGHFGSVQTINLVVLGRDSGCYSKTFDLIRPQERRAMKESCLKQQAWSLKKVWQDDPLRNCLISLNGRILSSGDMSRCLGDFTVFCKSIRLSKGGVWICWICRIWRDGAQRWCHQRLLNQRVFPNSSFS